MRICVDAGHGTPDPGAVGPGGLQEADVTLRVAGSLSQVLRKLEHDVLLTRKGPDALHKNKSADLAKRVEISNTADANCFVSIHCNAATDHDAGGFEVYHVPGSKQGAAMARQILLATQSAGLTQGGQAPLDGPTSGDKLRNRGVKQAAHYVTKHTKAPAVLIELAFITNPAEEALLRDPAWISRMSEAIAQGVHAWAEKANA